ncbi:MAG: discoidin domain-containing protein [Coprobacillaceae bacterium]
MRKAFRSIVVIVVLLGMTVSNFSPVQAMNDEVQTQEDIDTIKQRLKEHFLTLDTIDDGAKVDTCYVSEAKSYLESMNADGSWTDVNYAAKDNAANGKPWSPYLALDRLQAIAIAYYLPDNDLYQDPNVISALNNALLHWKDVKPSSNNWWENDIGVNLRFSRIGLFLEDDLSTEALNVIIGSLNKEGKFQGTGQNNLWYDQNALYRALITNDATQLKKVINECLSYVLVLQTDNTTLEALQVDNSLYFHGIQFYSNGYGLSMFRDVSFWLYMLRDTEFAMEQEVVDRMSDYMLDGTRWTIREDIAELYLGYREYKHDVGFTDYADEYIAPLERMMVVDSARSSEYEGLLNNIKGVTNDNGLSGNNYMWRVGYASHMRSDYGVNIKMDSKRIIGGDWRGSWPTGEDGGQLIYWTSSAASTIMVDGDEYTPVFPTYDWAHCPGTTTASRIPKDYSNYGRFTNGTDHTIGVSNGTYGSTAYVMNKKDTQATKGYFFFDDEFVALGAGITSKESVPIHTTLNQSKAENVLVDNVAVPEGTKEKSYTGNWIYNDQIGYVFPEEKQFYVSNATQKDNPSLWGEEFKEAAPATFTTWLDHGTKPSDGSYEYIVLPNASSDEVNTYANDIPITIVANTKDVQAVRHDGLKITQINFYKAGTLEYAEGKTITVDQPCSVIIDESGATPIISLGMTDTDYEKNINVDLDINGSTSTTQFVTAVAPYTGQTMTLEAGENNIYDASSYVDGHLPKHAYDGDQETYWKSDVAEDQWIRHAIGKSTFISTMTIDWKDNYAKKYKVQVSTDGINYTDVTEITDSDGGKDEVNIFTIASHVKIVCLESNDGQGYEIKEITYKGGENISLNKKVTASSTSGTDTGNVPRLAVDGNNGTRWSSSRDSDTESLMVDLGGKASINAVRVLWESARSSKYTIEVSNDGSTWNSVKTVEDDSVLLDEIIFDEAVEGRYLRINSTKSKTPKYGISIFELEVYGTVELDPGDDLDNIAIGKSATASSTNSVDMPDKAIDGNVGTFWKSAAETDHWFNVGLKNLHTIDRIAINWGSVYLTNYKIEYTVDGTTWNTLENVTTGSGGTEIFNLSESVDAKAIRIVGNTDSAKNVVINEFEIYGTLKEEERVNLALNKPSTASSEFVNTKSGFVLESKYAFDGSVENRGDAFQSRWVSKRESNDEWIQVDLEDTYIIDSLVLNWEGACGKEYKILVSNDNENWEEVSHVTDGAAGLKEITLDIPVAARYVKMQGIVPATKYGYSLWEFEVYGQKETFENVALNKETKASSEYIDSKEGNKQYYSSLAVDGKTGTVDGKQSRWVSNRNSADEWIYIDLDGVYDIRSVILNWEGACGKEYKLQVSNDAYTWNDVAHVTDGTAGLREFNFDEPVFGQYIRMQGIQPTNQYGYSLWEFEVYGKKTGDAYVDKTLLETTITEHTGIAGDTYTPDSYTAYEDALEAANTILDKADASQTEVNTAIDNLKAAVTALEEHDTEALEEAVALGQTKIKEYYTDDSYEAMDTLLQQAITLLKTGANNNEEYSQLAVQLTTAINNLVVVSEKPGITAQNIADCIESLSIVNNQLQIPQYEGFTITIHSSTDETVIGLDGNVNPKNDTRNIGIVLLVTKDEVTRDATLDTGYTKSISVEVKGKQTDIDYEGLKTVIALADNKDSDDYTASSYLAMLNIYQEAKLLIENGAVDNQEVETMRQSLSTAIQNLVSIVDLKATIEATKTLDANKYTPSSMLEVTNALADAEAVLLKSDATTDEITQAINTLNTKINDLIERANISSLEELIKEIEGLDTSKYTEESIKSLQELLQQAKELLENKDATQQEIDTMYTNLQASYDKLVEDGGSITPSPETPSDNPGNTTNNNQIKTSDTLSIAPYAICLLIAILGWAIIKKKKEV